MTLKTVITHMNKHPGETAVCTTTVTDSACYYEVPKMTICALRITQTAKAKILKAGGECLTFDELAIRCPTGEKCVLLQGKKRWTLITEHIKRCGVRRREEIGPRSMSPFWPSSRRSALAHQTVRSCQGTQVREGTRKEKVTRIQSLNACWSVAVCDWTDICKAFHGMLRWNGRCVSWKEND